MSKRIWTKPITIEFLHERNQDTMASYLGIEFTEIGDDFIKATMPINERTRQPMGILHGGASVVLAETLASIAANCVIEEGLACVGSEISASHLRPATSGLVTGITRPIRIGHTQQVWEIHLYNDQGKQTCISRMTATVIKRK